VGKLESLKQLKKAYLGLMFPQVGESVPRLRFAGFDEPWEQCKLGDVVSSLKSGLSRMLSNDDIGLPVVRANNIVDGNFDMTNDVKYWYALDPQGAQTSNYIVRKDDILINFINSESRMGTATIVNEAPARETIYTTNILNLRVNENATSYFIYMLTSTKGYKDYISSITKPAVSQSSFTTVDFKNYEFHCPTIAEQTTISTFFRNLDNAITIQKRKLDFLLELKKAYLQQMFPQAEESVPRLRFAGFTEPWELKKLGDIADIVRGASPRPIHDPIWFDCNSDIGWLRISDVTEQDGRIQYLEQKISSLAQEKTRVLTEPHLLLSIAATVGKPVINYVKTGVHDGFSIFMNPQFEQEFLFQWLEMFRAQWYQYGQPGSQINLNSDLVKAQEIYIPQKEEQALIGNFFLNLDNLIKLHN